MISSSTPTLSGSEPIGISISQSDVDTYNLTSENLKGANCLYQEQNHKVDDIYDSKNGKWNLSFEEPLLSSYFPEPSVFVVSMNDGRTLTINANYGLAFLE